MIQKIQNSQQKCSKCPLWRMSATSTAIILTGHSIYVNFIESKARNSLASSRQKLQCWNKIMNTSKLIAIPGVAGVIWFGYRAFKNTNEKLFLYGAIAMSFTIPYKLIIMRKTQQNLYQTHEYIKQGGYLTINDSAVIDKNMKKWDKLAKWKSALIIASAALFILAELNVLSKEKIK